MAARDVDQRAGGRVAYARGEIGQGGDVAAGRLDAREAHRRRRRRRADREHRDVARPGRGGQRARTVGAGQQHRLDAGEVELRAGHGHDLEQRFDQRLDAARRERLGERPASRASSRGRVIITRMAERPR